MNGFLADVPVDIGRDDARGAAAAELTDPGYRAAEPSPLTKLLRWLGERLNDLLNQISNTVPGGVFGLLVILGVLIAAIVAIRLKVGKLGRSARQAHQVFEGRPRSAQEYRRSAEDAAARGDFAEAVRERFRGIIRALEQRGLVEARSGRTAAEITADAGVLLPGCATGLREGARLFDDVHYGGRPATVDGYRQLVALDGRCADERPIAVGAAR